MASSRRRAGIAVGVAALALAALAQGSQASGWRVVGKAPRAPGSLRVLAPLPGDAAVLVSATDDIYEGPGDLTVDVVGPGQAHRRWVGRELVLEDAAVAPGAEVDLLARQGLDRLLVLRAAPDGSVRRVWETANAGGAAAIARGAIAWMSGGETGALWLATASAPGEAIQARRVAGVLPSWFGRVESAVFDVEVVRDGDGRITLALIAWRRHRSVLVLASVDGTGRVLARQIHPNVEGILDLQTAPGGRTAALVEDTGIEGEVGECVPDNKPRVIRVAVREPRAARFGPLQVIDRGPLSCDARLAQLLAGPDGRLAVLWGVAPSRGPITPSRVHMRLAPPGRPFGRRAAMWRRTDLEGAAFDATGRLFVLGTRPPLSPRLVVQRRSPEGRPEATEVVSRSAAGAGGTIATGLDGRPVVAWEHRDGSRRVAIPTGVTPVLH